jgi:hypothetical protein
LNRSVALARRRDDDIFIHRTAASPEFFFDPFIADVFVG